MTRFLVPFLSAMFLASCVPVPPPPVPEPPSPTVRLVQATIRGDSGELTDIVASLSTDAPYAIPCAAAVGLPRVVCTLDDHFPIGDADHVYGGHLTVSADGYETRTVNVALTGQSQDVADVVLSASFHPLPRIQVRGRAWVLENGQPFDGPAATAFNLFARYLLEGPAAIEPFLEQVVTQEGYRLLRVFTAFDICPVVAPGCTQPIGRLIPREHPDIYTRIPDFLKAAAKRGAYVEMVAFTGPYPSVFANDSEKVAHWNSLWAAVLPSTNGQVELVNEGDHPANRDIPFPLFARPPPPLLASHGSGSQDHDPIEPAWSHVTWHPAGGEWQRKPGHNGWEVSLKYRTAVTVNEMTRAPDQDESPDHFFDAGAGCKLFGVICTLHSIRGKAAQLWDAKELAAARALKNGVRSIPDACQYGSYVHLNDGPFLRVYEMTGVGPGCRVEIRH